MVTARLHDGSPLEVTVLGDGPPPVRLATSLAGRRLSLAAFASVENSFRLSDLAASPRFRCSRCA